jgi:hypothetical protein
LKQLVFSRKNSGNNSEINSGGSAGQREPDNSRDNSGITAKLPEAFGNNDAEAEQVLTPICALLRNHRYTHLGADGWQSPRQGQQQSGLWKRASSYPSLSELSS